MPLTDKSYQDMRKLYKARMNLRESTGPEHVLESRSQFDAEMREILLKHGTHNISLRRLAENTLFDSPSEGREFVRMLDPRGGGGEALRESGGSGLSGAFSKITGQIIYSTILERLPEENLIHDRLVTTQSTPFKNEKIPGIGGIGDKVDAVGEGEGYPTATVSAEYVETPDTVKRGLIVEVTDEMVFFDRTGDLLMRAQDQGMYVMINKEKRIIDAVTGVSNTFKYNGTSYNTYTDSGLYDNVAASNGLTDWTSVETARLLWPDMLDPLSGEPVNVTADTLLVPQAKEDTAWRIVTATELRIGDGSSGGTQTISGNVLNTRPRLDVVTNAYVSDRTSSTTTWFMGRPRRAFTYMENYPLQVVQEATNSGKHFENDIFWRYKLRERGAIAVTRPWFMVKSTA